MKNSLGAQALGAQASRLLVSPSRSIVKTGQAGKMPALPVQTTTMKHPRPTKEELAAAVGKTVPDIMAPGLKVLFCGINPGLYTAAVGHHFARPGNRFWPALCAAGFTDRLLSPYDEQELLRYGCGITNLVSRATTAASELRRDELEEGRKVLEDKIARYRPECVAVVGLDAFRKAFARPEARLGRQDESLHGSIIWLLPNTSGLNAHHRPADFARFFRELREAVFG